MAPDGSFEFPSIPAPAQFQVIAICRGWLIKSPDLDFFIKGKTFDSSGSGEDFQIAFEMEQTGSLELELMTTDGDSVVGANVSTSPNRFALAGYSTGLESNFKSLSTAERFLNGETAVKPEKPKPGRFNQVSGEEGRLKLYDIPAGRKQSLHVSHPNYILPIPIGEQGNEIGYAVQAGETLEKLLILENRKPK